MSTDAGTAVLIVLRARAQALHEAVAAHGEDGGDHPDRATALRDAADGLAALLGSVHEVVDPQRTAPVREELTALGAAAGAVRDVAALGLVLETLVAEVPRALVSGPVGDRLRHEQRARRERAAAALAEALGGPDGVPGEATLRAVDRLVITPPLAEKSEAKASKVLARAAAGDDRHLEEIRTAHDPTGAQGPGGAGDAALRGAALALAGSAALCVDEHGKKARKLAESAEGVVAAVDALVDVRRAGPLLVDLADRAHRRREPGFTYGLLHARSTVHAAHARTALAEALDEVGEDKRRSWLPGR